WSKGNGSADNHIYRPYSSVYACARCQPTYQLDDDGSTYRNLSMVDRYRTAWVKCEEPCCVGKKRVSLCTYISRNFLYRSFAESIFTVISRLNIEIYKYF